MKAEAVVEPKKSAPSSPLSSNCKHCNCRKSHCLMNYCKCFAASIYCTGCACISCQNTPENEEMVKNARRAIHERDKTVVPPKLESEAPLGALRGCHCRNAGCVKKYCECFSAGVRCGENCGCHDCRNEEGNPELLRALGLEPSTKRPKFNEELARHYSGGTSWHQSIERSRYPDWLKTLLRSGHNRDLIKAITSPFPASAASYGFVPSKKRNQAELMLEEELNPVQLQAIAFEMVAASRAMTMTIPPSSSTNTNPHGTSHSLPSHNETHTANTAPNSFGSFFSTKPPNPAELLQQKAELDQEMAILKILDRRLLTINEQLGQLQATKSLQSPTADTSSTPSLPSDTPPTESLEPAESTPQLVSSSMDTDEP